MLAFEVEVAKGCQAAWGCPSSKWLGLQYQRPYTPPAAPGQVVCPWAEHPTDTPNHCCTVPLCTSPIQWQTDGGGLWGRREGAIASIGPWVLETHCTSVRPSLHYVPTTPLAAELSFLEFICCRIAQKSLLVIFIKTVQYGLRFTELTGRK